jgi:hypothetical protein
MQFYDIPSSCPELNDNIECYTAVNWLHCAPWAKWRNLLASSNVLKCCANISIVIALKGIRH